MLIFLKNEIAKSKSVCELGIQNLKVNEDIEAIFNR